MKENWYSVINIYLGRDIEINGSVSPVKDLQSSEGTKENRNHRETVIPQPRKLLTTTWGHEDHNQGK